jgi:arylsulfatase A-like enzyme
MEERAWIRHLYDGEVRSIDASPWRFFDFLKLAGLFDDSLSVFSSDHGEESWEHERFEHGQAF